VMIDGLKLVRRLVNTPPMRNYVVDEYLPGERVQTEDDWLGFCREVGDTVFHPTSTCAIGKVVDEALRVKGIAGLRVIDASVMPSVPSGNINAAVHAATDAWMACQDGNRAANLPERLGCRAGGIFEEEVNDALQIPERRLRIDYPRHRVARGRRALRPRARDSR